MFLLILYVLLILINILVSKILYKTVFTPILFYSVLWSIVGFISNLGLYNYFLPSSYVNIVIVLSIVLFSMLYPVFLNKSYDFNKLEISSIIYNRKLFIIISILIIIFLFPYFVKTIVFVQNSSFSYLRSISGNSEFNVIGNTLISNLIESIVKPIIMLSSIYSAIFIFSEKLKDNKLIIFLTIIEVILYSIINASRILIVNYLFYLAISFIIFNRKKLLSFLIKEKTKVAFIVFIISLILIMQNLRSKDISIIETFYIYYFSGPGYLSKILEDKSIFIINNNFLFGSATFGFITNIFSNFQIILTRKLQGSVYLIGSILTSKQYYVSPIHKVNAISTLFYNFILDWGNIGVVFGTIFVAYISAISTKMIFKRKDIFSFAIYVFWINVLIRSIFKWDLIGIDFTVFLFFNWVLSKKVKRI